MAGMTPWDRRIPLGCGRPARFGCSRAFNAVIPAKAGIQVSRGTARPGGHGRPARIGRGDPTWQA